MVSLEFFIDINFSDRTMAQGSTQSLTEMSTRSISWGKDGQCVRLTTLPPFCAVVTKSGTLTSWNPLGHSRPVMGLLYLINGDRGSTVVKVLRYKSESRWLDPRWCHWNFSLT
jgi:hypothetical protein